VTLQEARDLSITCASIAVYVVSGFVIYYFGRYGCPWRRK
jgi:hypothetical protein